MSVQECSPSKTALVRDVARGRHRSYYRAVGEIRIVRVGLDRLDELVKFWELLHRHQASVAPVVPDLETLSDSTSAAIVREMYREWLSGPDSFAFLAEETGRSVGYVVGFFDEPHFMWETGRIGHIDSFYVLPEWRGRGVGRQLMDAAYSEMRRVGVATVALEMVADNDLARTFYEREGFTATFVQMHRRLTPGTEPRSP
jgi:GNAT superfamily N-acetyltransferase